MTLKRPFVAIKIYGRLYTEKSKKKRPFVAIKDDDKYILDSRFRGNDISRSRE